jgi:peptide/nickel transport system permease protein
MLIYIIKRLLLMIPTFFFIALIIFMVLNLAPGKPGKQQMGAEGTQNQQSQESRESYRIFKEQFNFDKPILLNTRFMLSEQDLLDEVGIIADFRKPVCPDDGTAVPGCLSIKDRPLPARVLEAQERIEDWGSYSVVPLIAVAKNTERDDVRRIALNQLTTNAQRRLLNEYGRAQTPEERKYNQDAQAENETLRGWGTSPKMSAEEVQALVTTKWSPWLEQHKERYEFGAGQKVGILFADTRFAKYMSNLVRLDFGVSHVDKKPVFDTILGKLRYSVTLSLLSILVAYFISVPLGVWSAYRQGTMADKVVTVMLFMLYSLPSFFIGVVLLKLLTVGDPLQLFPTGGFNSAGNQDMPTLARIKDYGWHFVLPLFCMTYGSLASLSRYARTGVLDVIRADYIRTARAKGLSEGMVIVKHAVRNGMIPILTLLGSLLPVLIGGSVIIEVIFNIPGMGLYLLESIYARDYNAIMAELLFSTALTLVGLLLSDLSYALVDPRISFD